MSKKTKMSNAVVKSLLTCLDEMQKQGVDFHFKVWYTLSWNRGQLLSADKHTDTVRIKLVEKYGSEDEKGVKTVREDGMADFQKEYIELLDAEETIEIRKISMSDLETNGDSMKGINGIFNFFEFLVEDEEPKKTKAGKKA